jgi:ABC-type multidrug transport system fused ATPase/permease subunit
MTTQNLNLGRSGRAAINRVWSSSSAVLSRSLRCVQPERVRQAIESQVSPLPATVILRGLNATRQAISTTFCSSRSQECPNLTCKSDGSLNIIFNDGGLSDPYGDQPKIVLAVLGMTGVGKSTFIKYATGLQHIEVGEGLESCKSIPPVCATLR